MRVLRERLSICECASFPFGFEGGVWDLIVLTPGPEVIKLFSCSTQHEMLISINVSRNSAFFRLR